MTRPGCSTAGPGASPPPGRSRRTLSRASTSRRSTRTDTGGASQIVFVVRNDGRTPMCSSDLRHDLAGLQPVRRQQPLLGARRRRAPTRSATTARSPRARTSRGLGCSTPSTRCSAGWSATATTSATRPASTPTRDGAELLEHKIFFRRATTSTGRASSARTSRRRATPASISPSSAATRCSGRRAGSRASTAPAPYRTLVTYKETHANAKIDPLAASGRARGATRGSARPPTAAGRRTH